MLKNSKDTKLNFNLVHDMAVSFASARMSDYKYPENIGINELRECRYSNFLTDYAYVISQYQKAVEKMSSSPSDSAESSLSISVALFDSIIKLNGNSN